MDNTKLIDFFKISLKRRSELLDKITEFVQENEVTKEEWNTIVKYLEGKE